MLDADWLSQVLLEYTSFALTTQSACCTGYRVQTELAFLPESITRDLLASSSPGGQPKEVYNLQKPVEKMPKPHHSQALSANADQACPAVDLTGHSITQEEADIMLAVQAGEAAEHAAGNRSTTSPQGQPVQECCK